MSLKYRAVPESIAVKKFGSNFVHQVIIETKLLKMSVTFDQNVKNAISAEFGILAVSLPDWWFLRTKSVIGTFGQTVRAGIF